MSRWFSLVLALLGAGLTEVGGEELSHFVTMRHGGIARIPVLENDGGKYDPSTLRMLGGTAFGAAEVLNGGFLRYRHQSGNPSAELIRYQVRARQGGELVSGVVVVTFAPDLRLEANLVRLPLEAPPTEWELQPAFPGIEFQFAHDFTRIPGTSALLITEADGTVQVIGDVEAPAKSLFLDIRDRVHNNRAEQALKGIAVHPDWPERPYIFLTYNTDEKDGIDSSSRLSRFTTTSEPPYSADPGSEVILIDQDMDNDDWNNHSISTLEFGADGYLYVGFGDEDVDQKDGENNSQHIDRNLWSCIIRIDVDCRPENLDPNPDPPEIDPDSLPPWSLGERQVNDGDLRIPRVDGGASGAAHYKVPRDNPFVHTSLGGAWEGNFNGRSLDDAVLRPLQLGEIRTEMFAMGVRNPWQFVPEDEDDDGVVDYVALGDVGREAREEVNFLSKGQNGGWAWSEGERPGQRRGQLLNGVAENEMSNVQRALWQYRHGGGAMQGDAVVGGFTYRGDRYPELEGKYIFADYDSGNIWSLQRTTEGAPIVERLAGGIRVTALGLHPTTGEILFLERFHGRLRKLVRRDVSQATFPQTLSETNFFADLSMLRPNPGGHPYDVNLRFWSDYAIKRRWFYVPARLSRFGFSREDAWTAPVGTIFAKHFDLEMRRGDPSSARRLETRFLVMGANGAYGVTYRWNHITDGEPQTEAVLVGPEGEDLELDVVTAEGAIKQRWHFPGRAECMKCHNDSAGEVLSFNTRQLNHIGTLGGDRGNMVELLSRHGYLREDPGSAHHLPQLVKPSDERYSLEARLRSWLDVNCAYCHRGKEGDASESWDGRYHLTLRDTGLVRGKTLSAPHHPDDRLLVPGQIERSILKHRMAGTGGYSRMPPLATNEVDEEAVRLISDYLLAEASDEVLESYPEWQARVFGAGDDSEPGSDPDRDGASNLWEHLTGTDPLRRDDHWKPVLKVRDGSVRVEFSGLPHRRLTVWKSNDLQSWSRWDVSGNGGPSLRAGHSHVLETEQSERRAFFRFEVK